MIDTDPNLSPPDDLADLNRPPARIAACPLPRPRAGRGSPVFGGRHPVPSFRSAQASCRWAGPADHRQLGRTARLIRGRTAISAATIKRLSADPRVRGMALRPGRRLGPASAKVLLAPRPAVSHRPRGYGLISPGSRPRTTPIRWPSTGGATPVCGWLLVNHLDRFSWPSTTPMAPCLGEVLDRLNSRWGRIASSGCPRPAIPRPRPWSPPQATPRIANAHLAAIVHPASGAGRRAGGACHLPARHRRDAVTVSPAAARADRDLDTLMGRPRGRHPREYRDDAARRGLDRSGLLQDLQRATRTRFCAIPAAWRLSPGRCASARRPCATTERSAISRRRLQPFQRRAPARQTPPPRPMCARSAPATTSIFRFAPEPQLASPPPFDATGSQYLTLLLDPTAA